MDDPEARLLLYNRLRTLLQSIDSILVQQVVRVVLIRYSLFDAEACNVFCGMVLIILVNYTGSP